MLCFFAVYCLGNLCLDGYDNGYNLYQYIGLEKIIKLTN